METTNKQSLSLRNKKAHFDYEILDRVEAGIVLSGAEVKAVRGKKVDFSGSYIKPVGGQMLLINLHIGIEEGGSRKTRKLLLKKKEILNLSLKIKQQKLTLIPLSLYTSGRLIKLELGLVKGKKAFEKRASIKKADIKREMEQELKNG